jgi:hypothetical protein
MKPEVVSEFSKISMDSSLELERLRVVWMNGERLLNSSNEPSLMMKRL